MATTAEQLTSVRAAIAALEAGVQSYRMGDETATMADYDSLCRREKALLERLARQRRRGNMFVNVNFPST